MQQNSNFNPLSLLLALLIACFFLPHNIQAQEKASDTIILDFTPSPKIDTGDLYGGSFAISKKARFTKQSIHDSLNFKNPDYNDQH